MRVQIIRTCPSCRHDVTIFGGVEGAVEGRCQCQNWQLTALHTLPGRVVFSAYVEDTTGNLFTGQGPTVAAATCAAEAARAAHAVATGSSYARVEGDPDWWDGQE